MAEETSKTPAGTVYKQVAPAGLAAEVTADNPVTVETVTALGRWLTDKLAASPAIRDRVATLSGLSVSDLTALMNGHPLFRLDTDHVQRIATALVMVQVIPHADDVWKAIAAAPAVSDSIVPPAQVVRTMSNNS